LAGDKGEAKTMRKTVIYGAMACTLMLQACSSRPREFRPLLAAAPASQAAFDAAVSECSALLVAGKLDSNGRLGSAGAGAAAGGAMAVGGAALASSAGLYGGMAVASATIVLLPFVAIGGAWGMAKMKRTKKENAVKRAMSGCLAERGHVVVDWAKVDKKSRKAAAVAATAT
jgi:hypothetical protein